MDLKNLSKITDSAPVKVADDFKKEYAPDYLISNPPAQIKKDLDKALWKGVVDKAAHKGLDDERKTVAIGKVLAMYKRAKTAVKDQVTDSDKVNVTVEWFEGDKHLKSTTLHNSTLALAKTEAKTGFRTLSKKNTGKLHATLSTKEDGKWKVQETVNQSSKIKDSIVFRIVDMSKEDQTDKVKEELYKLTLQFVRKYWRKFYIQYKGSIDDLASDFYLEFLTPKSREAGKEASLLDKFDPTITTLPYLVKVAVQRKLIDRSRTDKGEVNYSASYDEESGDLSLDYIAEHIDEPEIQVENIEFSEDEIAELRDRYDAMGEVEKQAFLDYYNEVKGILSPNFKALFKDLTGDSDLSEATVEITGKAPNFHITVKAEGKIIADKDLRAGNYESAVKKVKAEFKGIPDSAFAKKD